MAVKSKQIAVYDRMGKEIMGSLEGMHYINGRRYYKVIVTQGEEERTWYVNGDRIIG